MLKNDTRFLIHSLLQMFPLMSLPDLAKYTGKSKSTLSVHLGKMIEWKIAEEAYEEQARGSIKRKYYKLVRNADEQTRYVGKRCDEKSSKGITQELRDKIDTHLSFAKTKIKFMEEWGLYLESLKERLEDEANVGEVKKIIEEMKETKGVFTSLSFYSSNLIKIFVQKISKVYNEMEDLSLEESKQNPMRRRPFFASMSVLPAEKIMNYISGENLELESLLEEEPPSYPKDKKSE